MLRKTVTSLLVSAIVPALCFSETPHMPLSRIDILGRLTAGSSPSYVAHLVKTRGVSFTPSEYDLSLVRLAGGAGILLERLSVAHADKSISAFGISDRPYQHLAKCPELLQVGAVLPEQKAAFLDTLAEALVIIGQVDDALKTEEKALQIDPHNPILRSRLERFRIAAQSGRPPEEQ